MYIWEWEKHWIKSRKWAVAPPTIKKTLTLNKRKNKMSRLVHIPETLSEIEESISQKQADLVWWLDKLNRSRKPSLISMRSMQVGVVREQLAELEQAKLEAEEKALCNIA